MTSRLLVAVEFILTWVPSSRDWLTRPVGGGKDACVDYYMKIVRKFWGNSCCFLYNFTRVHM